MFCENCPREKLNSLFILSEEIAETHCVHNVHIDASVILTPVLSMDHMKGPGDGDCIFVGSLGNTGIEEYICQGRLASPSWSANQDVVDIICQLEVLYGHEVVIVDHVNAGEERININQGLLCQKVRG